MLKYDHSGGLCGDTQARCMWYAARINWALVLVCEDKIMLLPYSLLLVFPVIDGIFSIQNVPDRRLVSAVVKFRK